jgi:ABC-type multidrug transport system fused ATPase/permease subunit
MFRLITELTRAYRGTLSVVLLAMLVESLMTLAAPWPLKIILDNVVGNHRLPDFLDSRLGSSIGQVMGEGKLEIAAFAALAMVVIAIVGSVASYVENYYTENMGQWVAHDLRVRAHDHLQRLSLAYYDSHQTGAVISTLTNDIQTIQNFASRINGWHRCRPPYDPRNTGADVPAKLGYCSYCGGSYSVSGVLHIPIQTCHQKRNA